MSAPEQATAVELVRAALRLDPEVHTEDGLTDWDERVHAAFINRTDDERLRLIADLARLGSLIARLVPDENRSLFLALMAGATEAD